jgi:quercetin dioxygenase-like cupin family protein/DNA-binding XRE family transcriptional regulator
MGTEDPLTQEVRGMSAALKEPGTRRRAGRPQDAAKTVGARLRFLRTSQKVTLVELAEASGVDAATISRIETGRMNGTLESHIKLATALGFKVTDLYAGIEEARIKDAVTVQAPLRQGDVYVHEAGKSSIAMLTTDVLKKKLMPVLVTIEPGGSTHREEARVGTEKFLYVLDGTLESRIGEAVHALKRGSSLYLDASIPHSLKNTGRTVVKCLSVVTPPVL